ncbi:MAG: peroxiredoxin Q/BCP [Verrucomicrobia bacterium]|jgi:peroxiredoxin Q/BCP|nr:MAG: peroxiredoxin Q/BCP [Verrucomicrobiota bacterium]
MEKKTPEYPAVGTRAPEFAAVVVGGGYEGGEEVTLGMLAGRVVVLYFYPKDDTPGCTVQACGLRDAWEEVRAKALVFGVSVDSVASHEKFIGKHGLPFPLLSDPDHAVAEAYGVWVEKSMYGKKYMGVERTTVVIGEDGSVRAVLPKVSPKEHAGALLAVLG